MFFIKESKYFTSFLNIRFRGTCLQGSKFNMTGPSGQLTAEVGKNACNDTIGLRNASHLAPAAFLASADEASALVQQLLPSNLSSSPYSDRETALSTWELGLPEDTPLPPCSLRGRQKSWDQPRVEQLYLSLLSNCEDDVSRDRLLAAASKHCGA